MVLVRLIDVYKNYPMGEVQVPALQGANLEITRGEFTVFAGPSGSGKTTLLNLVGLLDVPTTGRVEIEGQEVGKLSGPQLAALRARRIGFIFQSFNLIPVLTAYENVELALRLADDPPAAVRKERVTEALHNVGLGDYLNRRPTQLSGGQQQRVAIARALVKSPALVIADEPTANLDSKNGAAILELMATMNRERQITFLFSSHDPMVINHAHRVVHLQDGQITHVEERRT